MGETKASFMTEIDLNCKCKFKTNLLLLANTSTLDQVLIPNRVESHTQLPL